MGEPVSQRRTRRRRPRLRPRRRVALLVALVLLAGILAYALSRLGLHRIGHALTSAEPGWIVLALALMGLSLLLRACSWHEVLRAALPTTRIAWPPVIRATMIGVMGSAVFPGRIGEPAKMLVLTRRLPGSSRRQLPIIAGTVFSQTLINLLALAILATATFTSLSILQEHVSGLVIALLVPLAICLQSDGGLIAAAAVLLAVNVSAVLPATPSNVGVFQAACLVVLAAYGVNAGPALAYGILLQAVEIVTALGLGLPALLGEGMTWRDIRGAATLEREESSEERDTVAPPV
jgi:uncharacterized membrane protein YbhN (UPF0104 family)